jgi:hypothetical protein
VTYYGQTMARHTDTELREDIGRELARGEFWALVPRADIRALVEETTGLDLDEKQLAEVKAGYEDHLDKMRAWSTVTIETLARIQTCVECGTLTNHAWCPRCEHESKTKGILT